MNEEDTKIIAAMLKYGGGFVKSLANAANNADQHNLQRLKSAFPDYWADYLDKANQDDNF